ncbi:MAG TPA: DUF2066 domain-containing protein [Wenzhouxiangellaceae bacterium]|nr:DUF2066 domain-containing protein [Wenzhouxiangellaceae bacterium]
MNIPRIIIVLLALAGLSGLAAAQQELYVGEAVVADGRPDARAPILDALDQVLIRLTGRVGEDVVATLGLDSDQASALALGRQFKRVDVPVAGGGFVEQRRLSVDFDPASVNRLIDEAGLLRWGSERPELLLWIVVEGERGAEYLEQDRMLQHAIDQLAFRYGIELTRPILDASDRVEVTPADVRGGFTGVATAAMRRYGADGVIMLDLRPNRDFWTGRWAWRIGDQESAFQRSGAGRAEVVELGLGRIAEALSARFAVRPSGGGEHRLVVGGIETSAHYNEVQEFLEALTGVDSVRVTSASDATMTFSVRASTDGLRQRIELTGPLEFLRHDLATDTLFYRFSL